MKGRKCTKLHYKQGNHSSVYHRFQIITTNDGTTHTYINLFRGDKYNTTYVTLRYIRQKKTVYECFKSRSFVQDDSQDSTEEYSNIYPTRRNVTQFILSGNCSTCFR
jgi:hypothetical protein